jgi:hypothetical protein
MTPIVSDEEIDRSEYACGDNSCIFGSPGGMATNGGCSCFEFMERSPEGRVARRRLSRGIQVLRRALAERDAEIARLTSEWERICKQREEMIDNEYRLRSELAAAKGLLRDTVTEIWE